MALGMVDTTAVTSAPIFQLPEISLPAVKDWSAVVYAITMIAPISIVTFVEHVGDITANGAVTGCNYIETPGLHRTLMGCGLASIFSGGMGGPAATTYSENTGVLAATRNYNPATLRIAAVFAIVLSLFGTVSGLLASIPAPVMGGVSIILFGMIASVGLRMLVENKVDFTKSYNLVIAAVMLVIGLGLPGGITLGNVNVSGTAIAALLGVILAKVLPQNDAEEKEAAKK
jgi:uracil permease